MNVYQYSQLQSDSNIRLIRFDSSLTPNGSDLLSIELIEARLSDVSGGGFEALSYTWGNPTENERTSIKVKPGDQILTITPNLHSFLRRLREDDCTNGCSKTYWADQICINQKDVPERNSQVAMMASIYRASRRTLVWLGEAGAGDGDSAALELLRGIDLLGCTRADPLRQVLPKVVETIEARLGDTSSPQSGIGAMAEDETEFKPLLDVLNPWVIQEVALAAECTVRVSDNVFRWESMDLAILAFASMAKKRKGTLAGAPILKTMAAAAIRHIQYCRKTWTSKKAQMRQGDFLHLLGRLSPTMDCTDPRDRVYAYLSLQENEPARALSNADYALTVEEVFMRCSAELAAASRCLEIFAYTRYPPIGPGSENSKVPSWAIDWRLPSTMSGLTRSVDSSFRASGSFEYRPIMPLERHELSPQVLPVRGKVIDVIGATATMNELPRTGDPFILMRYLRWSWILEMISTLWTDQPWNLAAAQTTSGAVLHQKVVKVLLCFDSALDNADGLWDEQLEQALRILETHEANVEQRGPGGETAETELLRRFASMTNRTSVRALYATQQRGLLGLSPPLTRTGDLVCVIHGSRTPIILRRSTMLGRYHVLGQAYLEEWMHGEHIWWSEEEANVFELE
ncbi:heterokaryon incompatibility protein-domain-containing protein [Podospora didyma]|uniref:Heterokaryon incompatibility protein-domain-containing protein n=1 Tax=Podospora didyma TaxID=330526 RepID=A0AAE0N1Y1_9PEZI|nr:heterokaryon incompatibility protein-domain-containing protein [Podospora didyma]